MKLFNSKPLNKMSRDELVDLILSTGIEKYLKSDIKDASTEELKKVASIARTDEFKKMGGVAKFFFYLGLISSFMFVVSLIRTHFVQSIFELIVAILSFIVSTFLQIKKGIKSVKE